MLISMETAIMIITNIIWRHVLLISTDCVGNYNVYSALLPVYRRLTLMCFERRGLIYVLFIPQLGFNANENGGFASLNVWSIKISIIWLNGCDNMTSADSAPAKVQKRFEFSSRWRDTLNVLITPGWSYAKTDHIGVIVRVKINNWPCFLIPAERIRLNQALCCFVFCFSRLSRI